MRQGERERERERERKRKYERKRGVGEYTNYCLNKMLQKNKKENRMPTQIYQLHTTCIDWFKLFQSGTVEGKRA